MHTTGRSATPYIAPPKLEQILHVIRRQALASLPSARVLTRAPTPSATSGRVSQPAPHPTATQAQAGPETSGHPGHRPGRQIAQWLALSAHGLGLFAALGRAVPCASLPTAARPFRALHHHLVRRLLLSCGFRCRSSLQMFIWSRGPRSSHVALVPAFRAAPAWGTFNTSGVPSASPDGKQTLQKDP